MAENQGSGSRPDKDMQNKNAGKQTGQQQKGGGQQSGGNQQGQSGGQHHSGGQTGQSSQSGARKDDPKHGQRDDDRGNK